MKTRKLITMALVMILTFSMLPAAIGYADGPTEYIPQVPAGVAAPFDLGDAYLSQLIDNFILPSDRLVVRTEKTGVKDGAVAFSVNDWAIENTIARLRLMGNENPYMTVCNSGNVQLMYKLAGVNTALSNIFLRSSGNACSLSFSAPGLSETELEGLAKPVQSVNVNDNILVMLPASHGADAFTMDINFAPGADGKWSYELCVKDADGQHINDLVVAFRTAGVARSELANTAGSASGTLEQLGQPFGVSFAQSAASYALYLGNIEDSGKTGTLLFSVDGDLTIAKAEAADSAEGNTLYSFISGLDMSLADSDFSAFVDEIKAMAGDGAEYIEQYLNDTADSDLSDAENLYYLLALAAYCRFDYGTAKLDALAEKAADAADAGENVELSFKAAPGRRLRYMYSHGIYAELQYSYLFRSRFNLDKLPAYALMLGAGYKF